jgi:hypothetical protein
MQEKDLRRWPSNLRLVVFASLFFRVFRGPLSLFPSPCSPCLRGLSPFFSCKLRGLSPFSSSKLCLLPVAFGSALLVGCAGYQVGNWSLYPSHIETVYVPVFQSASFRRFIGERLTEAVMKKIEERTPYKVVGTPDADSELIGEVVSDTKRVLFENRHDEPRKLEYSLFVRVRWVDRRGQLLREGPPIPLNPAIISVTSQAELIPEFGQSVATSSQQAIEETADQIVDLMEIPW